MMYNYDNFISYFQSYCEDTLDLALPDERMFLCHEHTNGASIIHPLLQTGTYFPLLYHSYNLYQLGMTLSKMIRQAG